MEKRDVLALMDKRFRQAVKKDKNIRNAYMFIHSDKLDIHLNISEGKTGEVTARPEQQYYIASIGKLFTSTLTAILVEQKKLSFEDSIAGYFEKEQIAGLHIYKGVEYTDTIRIHHLLNHTSGLHDYFSDKCKHGKSMLELIAEDPYRSRSPLEIINWSKENLRAHFPPGRGFHYSDTGYQILGIILEKVAGMTLGEAFERYIFSPLDMRHSYLATHDRTLKKSSYPVADVFMKDINATSYSILKDDFAGGGIVSTSEDLCHFMKALVHNRLVQNDTFERMKSWAGFFNLFFIGIDYGYGLMNFRTIPLIMPSKYHVWGNAGSIGSFMFYHPLTDTYFIGNLNYFGYHRKGIRMMFSAINLLLKLQSTSGSNY